MLSTQEMSSTFQSTEVEALAVASEAPALGAAALEQATAREAWVVELALVPVVFLNQLYNKMMAAETAHLAVGITSDKRYSCLFDL